MSKREKIIGVVLAVVVGIWGAMYLSGRKPAGPASIAEVIKPDDVFRPVSSGEGEQEAGIIEALAGKISMQYGAYDMTVVRDPFAKFEPAAAGLGFRDLALSGIMMDEGQPTAIINDEFLRKGDSMSGFTVDEIRQDEVVLIKGVERYLLKLYSEEE